MISRLMAMVDPHSIADWNLNAEDRAAIQWAIDAIENLKSERDGVRDELNKERHENWKRKGAIEEAARKVMEAIRRTSDD
jgi:predicted transcriptional regulator